MNIRKPLYIFEQMESWFNHVHDLDFYPYKEYPIILKATAYPNCFVLNLDALDHKLKGDVIRNVKKYLIYFKKYLIKTFVINNAEIELLIKNGVCLSISWGQPTRNKYSVPSVLRQIEVFFEEKDKK